MFDLVFREHLEKRSHSALLFFKRHHVSANTLTFLGLVLGLLASVLVACEQFMLAVICWWIGRLFDGFDGLVARDTGLASPGGAFFDLTADMIAYGGMVIGFYIAYPDLGLGWSLILYGYLLVTVTALALGSQEEKAGLPNEEARNLRLGVGVAEAGETGVAYTLMCFFPENIATIQIFWISLLVFTFCFRCYQSKKLHAVSSKVSC